MRIPKQDISVFKKRLERLKEHMQPNEALVLSAHPDFVRNNDVHHPYRQDSNLYYLTGFEEPASVLLFRPGKSPETVLFVRKKDPLLETWDGFRYGTSGAKEHFFVEEAFEVDEFEDKAPELLNECDSVYYRMYQDPYFDPVFSHVMERIRKMRGRSSMGHLTVKDSYTLISEMRLFKDEYEIRMLEKAAQISAEAHVELMKATAPGVNERALHGLFLKEIMQRGAAREAYGGIFAGGNNATTLHYTFNDEELRAGQLLLIDAGAEYEYYAGDITRTYPVDGQFSETQRRLYVKVLEVQKDIIGMVKPGIRFKDLQDKTIDLMIDLMISEKLLTGSKQEILEKQSFKKYYMHGVSHWLGMDVHDAGRHVLDGESRQLEAGMCFTIEPGLYIPANDSSAPAELRGIGIRIEDNILVRPTGHLNLTAACPKEPNVLEEIIGSNKEIWD